jgi:hypothetical protein
MNYLHARYQKSGKIRKPDMLYTHSLFALEPVRWVQKYEWRDLTNIKLCASGTFQKAMGDAILISFNDLLSYRTGWTHVLHWLDEIQTWSLKYEASYLIPAATNKQLAEFYLAVLFLNVPTWLNGVWKKVACFFVGERLREVMM